MTKPANQIDHVVYVVDASTSMEGKEEQTIKAIDNQTAFLAELSRQTGRETRVTVVIFSFAEKIDCVIYDKDVLRLPSIREYYKAYGNTALLDATALAIDDLLLTCTKYGDHAFLLFAFTDGQENVSVRTTGNSLRAKIESLGINWTVAALVPDVNSKLAVQQYGFPAGNISVWDTTSRRGVEEAGEAMKAALSNYSGLRTSGQSGTRTLFSTAKDAVNAQAIQAAGLKPLAKGTYQLVPVPKPKPTEGVLNKDKERVWEISTFVEKINGGVYKVGKAYYKLRKQERIQGNKDLAILEIATNKVFVGDGVRAMIGLPDENKSVAPDFNDKYEIYVQSGSSNRHLGPKDRLLILA